MIGLCAALKELLQPVLIAIVVLVTHCVWAYVQGQADSLSRLLHIAATLNNIFRGNFESCRAVLLLKAACKMALMIVLPLKHAGNLVDKL